MNENENKSFLRLYRTVFQILTFLFVISILTMPLKVKASPYPTMDDAEAYIRSLNLKSDLEIYKEIVKFCAENYDYDLYSSAEDMIKHGGGDCWASTDFIIQMCERFDIEAQWRSANREAGAGSGHRNAIARIGDTYYIGDAGFTGKKPRYYRVTEEPGGYWVNNDGVLIQYDGFDEDVYIPEKVGNIVIKTIGLEPGNEYESGAISGDTDQKMKSIHIPKTVETIVPQAFWWSYNLENIYVDPENKNYKAQNGLLLTKNGKELVAVPKKINKIDIPKGVEVIGAWTFMDSRNVEEVIIPNGVTTIKEKAFYSCYIERIFLPKTISLIEEDAFYDAVNVPFLAIPGNTVIEGDKTFGFLNYNYSKPETLIYTDDSAIEEYMNNMKVYYDSYSYVDGEWVPKKVQWKNPKVKYINNVYNGIDYSKVYNYYDYSAAHLPLWRECNGDPDKMLAAFVQECVWPNGIGLSYDTLKLEKGERRLITATVVPENAVDLSVSWSSSNPEVAEVDMDGNVTAKSAGEAIITGTTINGKTSKCTVTVRVSPTDITLNQTDVTMYFGDILDLAVTLSPLDVTEKKVSWSISDSAKGSVNNGTVRVWGAGNIKVTAKTVNGLTATCDILVLAEDNPSNPFADVKSGDWKYNAASYVLEKGYMNGKGILAGKVLFSPDTPINRSMFVQTLYNVEGKPPVKYDQKFNDVSEGAWYAKPVTWAAQNGIVAGNANGTFGVNGAATREQLAQMFYKYAVYKGYETSIVEGSGKRVNEFPDAEKVSSWAVNPLNWALSRGIMSGKGSGKLDPKGSATRAECATMLRNFMNAYKDAVPKLSSNPEFLEEEIISEEAIEKEVIVSEKETEKEIQEETEIEEKMIIQDETVIQEEKSKEELPDSDVESFEEEEIADGEIPICDDESEPEDDKVNTGDSKDVQ